MSPRFSLLSLRLVQILICCQTNINPAVSKVLSRCLEKDTKKRFRDIGDVQFELEQASADPSGLLVQPVAEVFQATPQSKLPWVAAIVVGIAIAGATGWLLKPAPAGLVSRFDYELPVPFRNNGRQVIAMSPDGRRFVYNGTGGLYVRSIDELEERLIPGTEGPNALGDVTSPAFSPDGQEIAYQNVGRLVKTNVNGSGSLVLAEFMGGIYGTQLEFRRHDSLRTIGGGSGRCQRTVVLRSR